MSTRNTQKRPTYHKAHPERGRKTAEIKKAKGKSSKFK